MTARKIGENRKNQTFDGRHLRTTLKKNKTPLAANKDIRTPKIVKKSKKFNNNPTKKQNLHVVEQVVPLLMLYQIFVLHILHRTFVDVSLSNKKMKIL